MLSKMARNLWLQRVMGTVNNLHRFREFLELRDGSLNKEKGDGGET